MSRLRWIPAFAGMTALFQHNNARWKMELASINLEKIQIL
jgi:hypothetical protein